MKNQQLRKHLKRTWRVRLRSFMFGRRLGSSGRGIYYDKNVEIQRYPHLVHLGDQVVIKEGARICACNETSIIRIGTNTTVGFHTFIYASESIEIGRDCLIAPFVYIVDSDHEIKRELLINEQGNSTQPVVIGDGVWLGTGAKILKGVTIGEGAVVAAGAVVTSDVGPFEIHGGIPAKKIGKR